MDFSKGFPHLKTTSGELSIGMPLLHPVKSPENQCVANYNE